MLNGLAPHPRSPTRVFLRIANRRFATSSRRSTAARDEQRAPAMDQRDARVVATTTPPFGHDQMPSLDFSRSLTACGLALPPDDFITWPTNHWIAAGLAFAWATLSGLAAMMSSTTFSI